MREVGRKKNTDSAKTTFDPSDVRTRSKGSQHRHTRRNERVRMCRVRIVAVE